MGGSGGPLMSDSYMGVRFGPWAGYSNQSALRGITVVKSLQDSNLPKENGRVASGYYVVPIDPNWCMYRYEYQE